MWWLWLLLIRTTTTKPSAFFKLLDTMEPPRLRLSETRQVLQRAKGLPPWARFLLLGLLVWVEDWLIQQKTVVAVDEAIKTYETLHFPEVVVPPPVYSETGNGFFDEMRLSAPWNDQEHPSDSP